MPLVVKKLVKMSNRISLNQQYVCSFFYVLFYIPSCHQKLLIMGAKIGILTGSCLDYYTVICIYLHREIIRNLTTLYFGTQYIISDYYDSIGGCVSYIRDIRHSRSRVSKFVAENIFNNVILNSTMNATMNLTNSDKGLKQKFFLSGFLLL